jgi:hypothetical protein
VARLKIAGCETIFREKISGAPGSGAPSGRLLDHQRNIRLSG